MQRAVGRVDNAGSEYEFGKGGARGLLVALGLALAVGLGVLLLLGGSASGAVTLPGGFAKSQLTSGLRSPTTMTFAPDGRLFVAEQGGTLRIVKNGQLLEMPFLNISSKVDSSENERGLLGVTLDPDFETNHYIYVYYTREATSTIPAHNQVARFTANGDRAPLSSEKRLIRLNNLLKPQHNGGALHFGKDGKLYIAVGENGNPKNAQSSKNLLGKMLRINSDGSIPADNPYFSNENFVGQDKAIWAMGLRNPFTFGVQPGTGQIFINDVGSNPSFHPIPYEEINRGRAGANYGWPRYEGKESDPDFQGPLYAYEHGDTATTGCAITGGKFYNPATRQFPAGYVGDYFFADTCNGWIRRLDLADRTVVPFKGMSSERPTDLDVDRNGSLFFLARGTGSVEKIRYVGN